MSLATLAVRDVTILSPGSVLDARGDTVESWEDATSTAAKGWLGRTAEAETPSPGRDPLRSEWTLRFLAGTPIDGRCRVEIDGEMFEVQGDPNRAWTPRGEHHVRVPLRKVVG